MHVQPWITSDHVTFQTCHDWSLIDLHVGFSTFKNTFMYNSVAIFLLRVAFQVSYHPHLFKATFPQLEKIQPGKCDMLPCNVTLIGTSSRVQLLLDTGSILGTNPLHTW